MRRDKIIYGVLLIILFTFLGLDIYKYFGSEDLEHKGTCSNSKIKVCVPILEDKFKKAKVFEYIPGNIVNYGMAAQNKNYIYFSNVVNNFEVSRIDKYGDIKKLTTDSGQCLNIRGHWLYYINCKNNKIYQISTIGNNKRLVLNESVNSFLIHKNNIFFVRKSDGAICSYDLLHSKKKVLSNTKNASSMNLRSSWIYYINGNDKNKIYKINLNGSKNIMLINSQTSDNGLISDDNNLYFIDKNKGNIAYKSDFEGKNIHRITPKGVFDLNVYNGNVFFTDSHDNIFRVSGKDRIIKKITNKKASFICIINNSIYFAPVELKNIFMCDFNGRALKTIE